MTEIAVVAKVGYDEIHKPGCRDIGRQEYFTLSIDELEDLEEIKVMHCARHLVK